MKPFDNISIVLTSPLYGGNIGSACRAMANMGLSDLVIAAPRKVDEDEASMMACSATDILKNRRACPTLFSTGTTLAAAQCHSAPGCKPLSTAIIRSSGTKARIAIASARCATKKCWQPAATSAGTTCAAPSP